MSQSAFHSSAQSPKAFGKKQNHCLWWVPTEPTLWLMVSAHRHHHHQHHNSTASNICAHTHRHVCFRWMVQVLTARAIRHCPNRATDRDTNEPARTARKLNPLRLISADCHWSARRQPSHLPFLPRCHHHLSLRLGQLPNGALCELVRAICRLSQRIIAIRRITVANCCFDCWKPWKSANEAIRQSDWAHNRTHTRQLPFSGKALVHTSLCLVFSHQHGSVAFRLSGQA